MYALIIRPTAETDAYQAAGWYNNIRKGLGDEFLSSLESKLETIKKNPFQFSRIHKDIRRALTNRFPYGVFFVVKDQTVIVLAILHTFRKPLGWKNRESE